MMFTSLCGTTFRRNPRVLASFPISRIIPNLRYESNASKSEKPSRPLRRRRRSPVTSRWHDDEESKPLEAPIAGLTRPFSHTEATSDEYLQKASLSPWVPCPDPVARKMLELAKTDSDVVHVDLGCGDGRLNYHAIDPPFSVQKSIGIDIDEKLLEMANERLSKRHPMPNVEFILSDLENEEIYAQLQEATVVTMYFVEDALKRIQPHLKRTFEGRDVRIVTCGYAMPGWEPKWVEVILGLPVFLYELRANEEIQLSTTPGAKYNLVTDHEELTPLVPDEYEDVEKIELPLFDPEEKIDFHWDTFDEEEDPGDPEVNTVLERYRNLKK